MQKKINPSDRTRLKVRLFLFVETVGFALAALVHYGILVSGYEHPKARIAEAVIAMVLLAGLVLGWLWPARTRLFAKLAQGFALFGTLIGIFTIAIGIGPRTVPDLIFHIVIIIVLVWGLVAPIRAEPGIEPK